MQEDITIESQSYHRQYVFYFRSSNLTFVWLISYFYLCCIFKEIDSSVWYLKALLAIPLRENIFWMKFYKYITKSYLWSVNPNIVSCLFKHALKVVAHFWQFWSNYFVFSEMFKPGWQFGLSDSLYSWLSNFFTIWTKWFSCI